LSYGRLHFIETGNLQIIPNGAGPMSIYSDHSQF